MKDAAPADKPYLWGARALMLAFSIATIWMIRKAWGRKRGPSGPAE